MRKLSKSLLIILSIFLILAYFYPHKNNKNIIWIDIYKGKNSAKYSMEYGEDILKDLSSLYSIKNLSKEQIKILDKSIKAINEVSGYRERYKNNHSRILKRAKQIFSPYNIKENKVFVDITHFSNSTGFQLRSRMDFGDCKYQGEMEVTSNSLIDKMSECTYNEMENLTGKAVIVSSDHALTEIILKLFNKLYPNSKIGVVVFDEHIDVYGTKDSNNSLGKENIFGKNLVEGRIARIIFIGASPDHNKNLTMYFDENFTKTGLMNKIDVYYDTETQNKNFSNSLSQSIKRMKRDGVSNIIFSVDVDVLPEEYTGFEYSILAPAIAWVRYYKYYYELPEIRQIGSVDFNDPFYRGLKTGEIISIIDIVKSESYKNNITIGYYMKNLTIVGDIQELLPEQDLNFKTTEAAAKIAEVMTE